jgi:hypothetical protein
MRLLKFSGLQKSPKVFLRRVVGVSMLPSYKPGQIVVVMTPAANLRIGDVVMVVHDGLEKIKRVAQLRSLEEVFLLGDNLRVSVDSRKFGWLTASDVKGKVVWPRAKKHSDYSG